MSKIRDPENIDEIDTDELLACVSRLAEEAGDWRDHLPYEALRHFNQRENIRAQFGEHVESCKYCQEIIEIFGVPRE